MRIRGELMLNVFLDLLNVYHWCRLQDSILENNLFVMRCSFLRGLLCIVSLLLSKKKFDLKLAGVMKSALWRLLRKNQRLRKEWSLTRLRPYRFSTFRLAATIRSFEFNFNCLLVWLYLNLKCLYDYFCCLHNIFVLFDIYLSKSNNVFCWLCWFCLFGSSPHLFVIFYSIVLAAAFAKFVNYCSRFRMRSLRPS